MISSTTPAETEPVCDNTSATSTSPSLCGTTSPSQNYTTVAPSKPVTLSPGAGGFGNVPIIIGVAGGLIAIITMATVIAIVVCLCVKSRMCVLADTHKGKDNYFYDNPLGKPTPIVLVTSILLNFCYTCKYMYILTYSKLS